MSKRGFGTLSPLLCNDLEEMAVFGFSNQVHGAGGRAGYRISDAGCRKEAGFRMTVNNCFGYPASGVRYPASGIRESAMRPDASDRPEPPGNMPRPMPE